MVRYNYVIFRLRLRHCSVTVMLQLGYGYVTLQHDCFTGTVSDVRREHIEIPGVGKLN